MTGFSDFVQPSEEVTPPAGAEKSKIPASFSTFLQPRTTNWGGETRGRIGATGDSPQVLGEGVPPEAYSGLKKGAGEIAAIADLPAGIPSMVAKGLGFTGGVLGTGAAALKSGKPVTRKELVGEGARVGEETAAPLANPIQRLMRHLGYGNEYDQSDVQNALGVFSNWIKKGNKWVEEKTNGAVLEEDADQIGNAIMAGGPVELAKSIMKLRPKGETAPKPGRVDPGPLPPRESHPEESTAADDFVKRMDKESEEIAKQAEPVKQEIPSIPAGKPRIRPKPVKPAEEAVERPFADTSKWDTPRLERIATAAEKQLEEAKTKFEESKAADRRRRKKSLVTEELSEHSQRLEDQLGQVREELATRQRGGPGPSPAVIAEEVPTRPSVPKRVAGKIDPKLLIGAGLGAAAGAAAGGDQHRVSGAIAGALGGALLSAFASKMFPKAEGGAQAGELSDSLFKLTQQGKARQIELLKFSAAVPTDYRQHAEQIYHSLEDPTVKLSPRAAELKAKYVDPIMRQNALLREDLKKRGLDVGEDVDAYVHRVPKGKPSIFEQFERSSPQGRTLSQFAPPLEERTVFKLTDPETRESLYGVKDEEGQGYKVYQGKKIVGSGKISPKAWKEGKVPFGGRMLERSQATTKELEAHTLLEYHHDALASAIASNARLSRIRNNNIFLENLLRSPNAHEIALKSGAPKNWREVPQIPQLRGYKFAPRVANVLEDFAGRPEGDLAAGISKISRIMAGSMFWNPLPHIFNVLDHSIVQRGLVSGWLNPAAYPRLMRTTLRAAKAVTEQNEDYLRFVREGAGLMYPNVLLQDFSGKVLEQLGQRSEMGPVAKAWGYANPAEMVRRIYSFSRKNLWAANDILMMQAYLEKEMVKPETAIADVEKHIPNYRVPDVVIGSRLMSQALQSPIVTAFGRYDYGRMKSYGEMIKGLVGREGGLKDRAKALDQIAMLTVMGVIVYPLLLDNAARAITGNPNAEATRFGAGGIPYLVYSYLHGKKQFSQVLSSSYPMGMAVRSGIEIASNRDLYTGRHLFEDPSDIASYMAKQLSPVGTAAKLESGQLTPGQFAASAVGIRSPPTPAQKRELAAKRRRDATKRRIDAILNR